MKVWNNYVKNEWIILIPVILACVAINENSESIFWNNLSYWIGNIAFYLLMAMVALRTFIAFRNWFRNRKG